MNKDLKSLLKSGIFGKTSSGNIFVTVNNIMVYEDGFFDYISSFDDELMSKHTDVTIDFLAYAKSFNNFKKTKDFIYLREEDNKPKIYKVNMVKALSKIINVEADNYEEAKRKVYEKYDNNDIEQINEYSIDTFITFID